MSLPRILKTIAQKSSHPNALLYKLQLAKAQIIHLPDRDRIGGGRLSDGSGEEIVSLGAPDGEVGPKTGDVAKERVSEEKSKDGMIGDKEGSSELLGRKEEGQGMTSAGRRDVTTESK